MAASIPPGITRVTDTDLADIALKENGTLLVGTGNPNGGFMTTTDGTLTLAVGLRYRNNPEPIPTSWVNNIDMTDEDGNRWVFVISAYMEGVELPLTDYYEIQLVVTPEIGPRISTTPVSLAYDGLRYTLYTLPRQTNEPDVGKINVIQEIVRPDGPLGAGRYTIGLEATSNHTGLTFGCTTTVTIDNPVIGTVVDDPILGLGIVIG